MALLGFEMATEYGAADFLKTLVNIFPVEIIPEHLKHQLLKNAVMSDCPTTCDIIKIFINTVPDDVIDIAEKRGNSEIMTLFSSNFKDRSKEKKEKFKKESLNKTANDSKISCIYLQ